MRGPPHPAGWVPGDDPGAAEGAALPGDHPLLRQREGKKKKKKQLFCCFLILCAPSCHVVNTFFFHTWCLWNQKFVADCVSEGFVHGLPAGASK